MTAKTAVVNNTVVTTAPNFERLTSTQPIKVTAGGNATVAFAAKNKDGVLTGKTWLHIATKNSEVSVSVDSAAIAGRKDFWAVVQGVGTVSTWSERKADGKYVRHASLGIESPVMLAVYTVADFNGEDKCVVTDVIGHNPITLVREGEVGRGEFDAFLPMSSTRMSGTWTHEQMPDYVTGELKTVYSIVNGQFTNRVNLVPTAKLPKKEDAVVVEGSLSMNVGKAGTGQLYVSLWNGKVINVNGVAS